MGQEGCDGFYGACLDIRREQPGKGKAFDVDGASIHI